MSKTDKTAPARIQARNKVASDPYRYTKEISPRDRFTFSLVEGSENTFIREVKRIFRASEVAQMEQFLSEVEPVTDKKTTRFGVLYHEVTTRKVEVKEVTGYLQMDSSTPASPDTPWDDISRRVDVTERPARVIKHYKHNLDDSLAFRNCVVSDYDVFKVVTVTETMKRTVVKTYDEQNWFAAWDNKMFKRNYFDKMWNKEKARWRDEKHGYYDDDDLMDFKDTMEFNEGAGKPQKPSESLQESSMLIHTSES